MEEVDQLRAEGKPTVPTTMYQEKRTNPFLQAHQHGDPRATEYGRRPDDVQVFAEVRRRKDRF